MDRSSLPPHLGQRFSVAGALRAGVPPSRLRAHDLVRPFRGVRVVSRSGVAGEPSTAEEVHLELARHYSTRMPAHEFLTHLTSAIVWGVPLPHRLVRGSMPVDVGVLLPLRAPRGRGVRGHALTPAHVSVRNHRGTGLRVASPATTWAMLGAVLRHPYDLIAAADALVRVPRSPGGFRRVDDAPIATVTELATAVAAGRRVGVGALRAALPLVRTGSSSRTETWTRLTLVDGGLPEPVLDHDVYDGRGVFLACLDMAYPELRVGIEYEGDHHRTDAVQWAKDIERIARLEAVGWIIIRVTKDLLFTRPRDLVARVRSTRARAERGVR